MYRILPATLLLIATPALAAEGDAKIPTATHLREDATTPPEVEAAPEEERPFHHEISFRGRMYSVPDSILDIWYFNETDEGWVLPDEGRPKARGYGLGIEYVVKGDAANGIFYFDYMASTMTEGYWDDVEEPPNHLDGSYLDPAANFGLVAFGADFGYEVHFVRTADTNGNFGLSLMPGAGLGVAVVTGEIAEWTPDEFGNPSYILYQNGEPEDGPLRIPGVLPMVDINLALRFNFADRAVLRVETGFHDVLFYGATMGIMF